MSEDIQTTFEQAQVDIKTLTKKPSNEELLQLYSLFKQGSKGDVEGSRPGMLNPVGRAKFDAWAKHKGSSQEDAKKTYVELVVELKQKYA